MKKKLQFDPHNFRFTKTSRDVWRILRSSLFFLLVTFADFVVTNIVLALVFTTDVERRMIREKRAFKKVYPSLLEQKALLSDAIASLQYRDNEIYDQVFHANAPGVDPMSAPNIFAGWDSIPDSGLNGYTGMKADMLLSKAQKVEKAFGAIASVLSCRDSAIPPMLLPVKDISYTQVGASRGSRMSPFLKAYIQHSGIDLLVPRGSDVLAASDGVVKEVRTSRTMGKTVTISHEGGYETFYAHLEMVSVRKGGVLKAGDRIGSVGMTGKAYAPLLHYEVRRGEEILDPVNHFFASVSPDEYANMLYMSVNTMQSME